MSHYDDAGALSDERQRLLDQVEENNELLARLGVPTRLPYSKAAGLTTAELVIAVRAQRAHFLENHHRLSGLG
jgi:hypothetical protein